MLLIQPAVRDAFDPATTLTYDGDTNAKVGGNLTLAATLVGSDGPIPGAVVTFDFRGVEYQTTTGTDGRASLGVHLSGAPGDYEVVSVYAGSDRYSSSEDRASVRVTAGRS